MADARQNLLPAIILTLMLTSSCKNSPSAKEYYWLAGCSAPSQFPVELIAGGFYTAKDEFVGIPESSFVSGEWGVTFSHDATDIHPIAFPDTLSIVWFAIRERTVYGGKLSLGHLPFQQVFDEGLIDGRTGHRTSYDEIRIGLAPGGYIVVWAVSPAGSKEIGMVQAAPFDYDMRRQIGESGDIEAYVKFISDSGRYDLRFVHANDPEALKWSTTFRKKWPIRLRIATSASVTNVFQKRFDGSTEELQDQPAWETTSPQAIPKGTNIAWKTLDGTSFTGRITYDETEIFAAFDKLESLRPQAPLTLQLEINQYDNSIHAFLTDGTHLITLQQTKTEVWR